MSILILLNKPYGVLSQFTPEGKWRALDEFISVKDVYVAGRLDADSEGLLILTDDGKLQARIADPKHKLEKTYWAQVEGIPDEVALDRLRAGVALSDFTARPANLLRIGAPAALTSSSTIPGGSSFMLQSLGGVASELTTKTKTSRKWSNGVSMPNAWSDANVDRTSSTPRAPILSEMPPSTR